MVWYMHILSGKSKCIDRLTGRERERMCVLFEHVEFRHFLNSKNSSTYFKVSCISLQKNLTDAMSLSDCITI